MRKPVNESRAKITRFTSIKVSGELKSTFIKKLINNPEFKKCFELIKEDYTTHEITFSWNCKEE